MLFRSGIKGGFNGFLKWVLALRKEIGIPHALKDIGIDTKRLDEVAKMAVKDPSAGGNPIQFTEKQYKALAKKCTHNRSPAAVALTRQMLWRNSAQDHPIEAHRVDSRAINSRGASADAREGVTSFLEKRPANFPVKVSDGLPDVFPDWTDPQFS